MSRSRFVYRPSVALNRRSKVTRRSDSPVGSRASVVKSALAVLFVPLTMSFLGTACAAGDTERGKKVFRKCSACHAVGPKAKNKIGPILNGIVGRKAGTVAGYKYSNANKIAGDKGLVWTEVVLLDYLVDPRKAMPGTKMVFAGVKDEQDRNDVIAYLKTFASSSTGADAKKEKSPATATAEVAEKAEPEADKKAAEAPSDKQSEEQPAKAAEKASKPKEDKPTEAEDPPAAEAPSQSVGAQEIVSPPELWVAGEAPSIRPPWAPRIEEVKKTSAWYEKALTGLSEPYPLSFGFLEDQGNWYTPFNHPGMTDPYDLRDWHRK